MLRLAGLVALAGVVAVLRRRARIDLRNRVVAIFGGSRGLGLALARELVREGACVALVARTESDLQVARETIYEWEGRRPFIVTCDVTRREAVNQAIDRIVGFYGRLDVLINDAGTIIVGPHEHMRATDFERAIATHLYGPLYAMEAAIPIMREQGGGSIVNISSIGGRIAFPHLLPYTASKFALVGLSDGMRAELAREGIRVTTVCPGLMRTGAHLNIELKGNHQKELAWFAILDSLPGVSMSAGRAARRIVKAIRHGERELTIGLPAKLAVLMNALAPETTAAMLEAVCRMLPAPRENGSAERRSGWQSRSKWVPSTLTRQSDRAAAIYNELKGHAPEELHKPA